MWTLSSPSKASLNINLPTIHFISHLYPTNAADVTFFSGTYFKEHFFSYPCTWHKLGEIEFELIKTIDWIIFCGSDVYHPSVVPLFNKCITKTSGRVITWGCGYKLENTSDKFLDYSLNKTGFAIFTTRDYNFNTAFGTPERYLPCPSCMQPGLDVKREIVRDVGVIEHKLYPINYFPQYDKLNNSIQAIQLMDFIASSHVIVTNSFHMAYWSTLLGKKVILANIYAEKYDHFKYPPTMYSGDLQADIQNAKSYPEALEECRALNKLFADEVLKTIQDDDDNNRLYNKGELMNPKIIFFGAVEYVNTKKDEWSRNGLTPACYSDMDENKHYFSFDGLKILPVIEIVKRFPNYMFYITYQPEYLIHATNYLINFGIPRECIKYADPYEWRKGCSYLGNHISFGYKTFAICCMRANRTTFEREETIAQDFDKFNEICKNLIDDWRNGNSTFCDGCRALHEGIWNKEPKLSRVGLCSDFAKTSCNIKCIYCCDVDAGYFDNKADKNETSLDFLKKIYTSHVSNDVQLGYGAGEITIHPQCDEILNFIETKNIYTQIATNALVYNDKIANLMKSKIIEVCVSVDAGSKKTFEKIKGADFWQRVINNLEIYAGTNGLLSLKYILLEDINDNEDDILGFLDLSKRLNCPVSLTPSNTRTEPLTNNMMDACILFIKCAKKYGLNFIVFYDHFFSADGDRLKKVIASTEYLNQNNTNAWIHQQFDALWEVTLFSGFKRKIRKVIKIFNKKG